jgi:hypothetical protein
MRTRHVLSVLLYVVLCAGAAIAGPKIKADIQDFDAGEFVEGAKKKVKHTFIISNTGNEALKIKEVKPG